jgi:hypothetical protein
MALDTSSQLPAPGVWFRGILDELDAGANPRELATRVLQESTMLLPILTAHLSWEMPWLHSEVTPNAHGGLPSYSYYSPTRASSVGPVILPVI